MTVSESPSKITHLAPISYAKTKAVAAAIALTSIAPQAWGKCLEQEPKTNPFSPLTTTQIPEMFSFENTRRRNLF